MSKWSVILAVLGGGCSVSPPSLLNCTVGQAAVVQADGGWACQLVPSQAAVNALSSGLTALEGTLASQADGGVATVSFVTQVTQPLNLWVRTDGSDTSCNGQADSPVSGASPSCAVATLQRAIDLVPAYINAAVTITIGNGTFVAPSTGPIAMGEINKAGKMAVGSLTITGSGSTTLQGAAGVSTGVGILVNRSSVEVNIQNLTLIAFGAEGVVVIGSEVVLSAVTIQQAGAYALKCEYGASCSLSGASSFESSPTGVRAQFGSYLYVEMGGSITVSNNTADGIDIDSGSQLEVYGNLNATDNQGAGFAVYHGGSAYLHQGNVSLSGNGGPGMVAEIFGEIDLETSGTISIDVPSGGGPGIHAVNGGYLVLTATAAVTVTCESATSSIGVEGDNHSAVDMQGSGAISISGCGTGIEANFFGYVRDLGGGGTRAESSANEVVNNASIYVHGGFPAAACGTPDMVWCE